MTPDLFDDLPSVPEMAQETVAPGAVLLRGFARPQDRVLLTAIESVLALAPLRHLQTPGGFTMSVAMSNCGALGWTSDAQGYRYAAQDPLSHLPWPAMPDCFLELARKAAAQAGYANFQPTACLINEYRAGAKLSLHQDKDELDLVGSHRLGVAGVTCCVSVWHASSTRPTSAASAGAWRCCSVGWPVALGVPWRGGAGRR